MRNQYPSFAMDLECFSLIVGISNSDCDKELHGIIEQIEAEALGLA